jgi:hypothetical protein
MEPGRITSTFLVCAGFIPLAGLGTALLLSSCSPGKDPTVARRDSTVSPSFPTPHQNPIPPNTCRVHATVVSVESTLVGGSPADPCSRFPCRANVRIDEVLGFGPAFTDPLVAGQTVSLLFTQTLAPSRIVAPAVRPELPGLTAGDAFTADISGGAPPIGNAPRALTVQAYTLRR